MKKIQVIEHLWSLFKPRNRYDLLFDNRYVYVADVSSSLERMASRLTVIGARKALDIRSGRIAGRHVWYAPRVSLDRVLSPTGALDPGRRKRRSQRRMEKLLPVFKQFMIDIGFAVPAGRLFLELKTYMRPHSFTYGALSAVKKATALEKHEYKGHQYLIYPAAMLPVMIGNIESEETIGSFLEGIFEVQEKRELPESLIMREAKKHEKFIHPAIVHWTLKREFKYLHPDTWRSKSL